MARNAIVTLNRAVAVAMTEGPGAALAILDGVERQLPGHHRVHAVRAHLLEMAGDHDAAGTHYRAAAERTTNLAERAYLNTRADRLSVQPTSRRGQKR